MKHGEYWVLKNLIDLKYVHPSPGYREPTETNTIQCETIESTRPFDEGAERFESTRWFKPLKVKANERNN